MPTWGEILGELKRERDAGEAAPFDKVRRKYLKLLRKHTKRNIILYASAWTQGKRGDPATLSIADEDLQGLMEVIHRLKGDNLDLIIHSPGGSPEATEAFANYLRSKFSDIRVFIPQAAMSAATMLACAGNIIVMGKHSSLGPIDPQFILQTQLGAKAVPAQAILDQFEMAKRECEDPARLGTWMPILSQYGPALLVQCTHALELAEELVTKWLTQYMFAGDSEAGSKASKIAKKLANHSEFKSHARHISREQAEGIGLRIYKLEEDQRLQNLVLSVFHATTHTFTGTPALKIVENHLGRAFIKQQAVVVQQVPAARPAPGG